jgi:hypothetical protein
MESTSFAMRAYCVPDIAVWYGFVRKDLMECVKQGLNSYLTWPRVAGVTMRLNEDIAP